MKHYEKASAQLSNLCHTIWRKLAPPDVKLLVYTLSIKAQIRYPAGLAPWTLQQYRLLNIKPTSLLRQVYDLRRTFPTALIYLYIVVTIDKVLLVVVPLHAVP
jgi:hypothetical protein